MSRYLRIEYYDIGFRNRASIPKKYLCHVSVPHAIKLERKKKYAIVLVLWKIKIKWYLGDDTTTEKQRAITEANGLMEQLSASIQKCEADAATLAKVSKATVLKII